MSKESRVHQLQLLNIGAHQLLNIGAQTALDGICTLSRQMTSFCQSENVIVL